MPISVTCKCGKKLKAPDTLLGKRVKCPACQQVLTILEQLEVIKEGIEFIADAEKVNGAVTKPQSQTKNPGTAKRNSTNSGPFPSSQIERDVRSKKTNQTDEVFDSQDGNYVNISGIIKKVISGQVKSIPANETSGQNSVVKFPKTAKIEIANIGPDAQPKKNLSKAKTAKKMSDFDESSLIKIPRSGQLQQTVKTQVRTGE